MTRIRFSNQRVGRSKRRTIVCYMGNCMKPVDPLAAQIPRDYGTDATAVKESGLPIIFLMGAPGSGKRTQSPRVAERYGFLNLMCADILRDEVSTRSERGIMLARIMSAGRLVPADVLLELLKTKMLRSLNDVRGFLLTGFPKDADQGRLFDRQVKSPDLVLCLQVKHNSLLLDRVMAGQVATTAHHQSFDTIQTRLKEYNQRRKPIMRHYRKKVAVIDSEKDVPLVYDDICKAIDDVLNKIQLPLKQTA